MQQHCQCCQKSAFLVLEQWEHIIRWNLSLFRKSAQSCEWIKLWRDLPFKVYLLHWEKLLLLGTDFHSLFTLRLYCLCWSAREFSSCQVSMAGWAQTSHVNSVNKYSLFCLSSVKCLYPPQGKWPQEFEVCHLPANGVALGRKCVPTVQELAGCWLLWRINLLDKWW